MHPALFVLRYFLGFFITTLLAALECWAAALALEEDMTETALSFLLMAAQAPAIELLDWQEASVAACYCCLDSSRSRPPLPATPPSFVVERTLR